MSFNFSEEVSVIKEHSYFVFNNLYPKLPYYRPEIEQKNDEKMVSVPTTVRLKKLFDIPAIVKVTANQELLSKFNLVSDPYDIVVIFPILPFEKNNEKCLFGDVFEYLGIQYEILKVIAFDFYKNTSMPINYLTTSIRYLQKSYQKDIDSEVKNLVPAKTADQFDKGFRNLDLVKDPDNPDYIVRN